jgi:thiamine-monophosphate kinase
VLLSELGELGLLAELERRGLARGIEDDAARIDGLVVTQDTLVEDVHFRLGEISWRDLGFRAGAVNLSDLAASGARPVGFVVSLGVQPDTDVEDVVELYQGIAETGVPVIGGDTTRAAQVVLSVTALGRAERTPGRGGARPGDLLVVTGPLGGKPVRPPIRIEEGIRLARHAHAMLDISDGLARDAGHIAARSGVRCVIELDRVPLAEGATVADLGYGEDFELLAAVEDADGFTVIGRCEEGEGVEGLGSLAGFDHFR